MVPGIMAESMQMCPTFAIRTKTTRTRTFSTPSIHESMSFTCFAFHASPHSTCQVFPLKLQISIYLAVFPTVYTTAATFCWYTVGNAGIAVPIYHTCSRKSAHSATERTFVSFFQFRAELDQRTKRDLSCAALRIFLRKQLPIAVAAIHILALSFASSQSTALLFVVYLTSTHTCTHTYNDKVYTLL